MEDLIFKSTQYEKWFQHLRDQFSPNLIDTESEGDRFISKGKVVRDEIIGSETLNKYYMCYTCSINGPDLLFDDLRIRDKIDEPFIIIKDVTNVQM